jgi:hypothetical protein
MSIAINEYGASRAEEDENTAVLRAAGFWIRFLAFLFDLAVIAMSSQIFFRLIWPSGLETTAIKSFILVNSLFPGIWGSLYFMLMTKFFGTNSRQNDHEHSRRR